MYSKKFFSDILFKIQKSLNKVKKHKEKFINNHLINMKYYSN